MKVAVIGAGRIGRVHIENISMAVREMEIKTVADPYLNADGEAFVKSFGIQNITKDVDSVFADPEIEAVLICSSTDTHADLIVKAAAAGKHIFCEKPVDHDVARVRMALDAVKKAGVKLQIGFVRRFDHNHRAVYDAVSRWQDRHAAHPAHQLPRSGAPHDRVCTPLGWHLLRYDDPRLRYDPLPRRLRGDRGLCQGRCAG